MEGVSGVPWKGCQGFQETNMHNGGRLPLEVKNLYIQIKIHVAIFDTKRSITQDGYTWNLLEAKMAY
jgi:hypothetical protein